MTGRMSILCCGRGSSTPVDNPPTQIQPPKILRRLSLISMPRLQTTRQSIEAFYNEGKELLQARQEENEGSSLRPAVQTAAGTTTRDYPKDGNIIVDSVESGRDPSPQTTWSQPFGNEGSKMLVSDYFPNQNFGFQLTYLTRKHFSIRLPFRSSSANELRPRGITVVSTINTRGTMNSRKSMPILGGNMASEVAQKTPRSIPSDPSKFPGALALSLTDISSLTLTNETAASKTSTTSGVTRISMPSISAFSPYLMPSIATTIASTNKPPRTVPPGTDDTTTKTGKDLVMTTRLFKERRPSNDTTASDECFSANEVFSNISAWVRPSTSTFMSFPSSPDPNRSEVPQVPFCVGSTPDIARSVSSKFYSLPETAVTGNTRTSTPAPFRPPTPKYHFRPSVDNASSFYPSCETSRCQSLAGSVGTPRESLDMSVLSASAAARMLNITPRPSARVSVEDSLGYSTFRFPWMNRGVYNSPESTTKEEISSRSSSLAHLDRSQTRGRDPRRVPRVKPRALSKHSQPDETQKYNKAYEEIHLQECDSASQVVAESFGHFQTDRHGFIDNDGNQERYDNDTMTSPTNTTHGSGYAGWIGFPTRVSSLPVPNGMSRDARNRRPPNAWKYGNPKGGTFSNYRKNDYNKNDKINSLRNSVSLGEWVWERHDGNKSPQRTGMANVLAGPMSDLEPQDGDLERNSRQTNKRAMIRSRSMTLRRTFTNSIAKLRGKVSFSGSSKVVLAPPSPIDRSGNRDRFYQMRHGEQKSIDNTPEILNGKVRQEVGVSKLDMSSIIFRPTLPEEMLEHNSEREFGKDTSPENGDVTTTRHDGLAPDSPLSLATIDQSAFGTASEGPSSRPWSTIYDDCVAFPFAEDEAGDGTESELEKPMSGFFDAREVSLA